MLIDSLFVENFRNLSKQNIYPSTGINIFIGNNGQGKTSALEAIYLVAANQSPRSSKLAEYVRAGKDYSRIALSLRSDDGPENLEIKITKEPYRHSFSRVFFENGNKTSFKKKRASSYCVLFSPQDLRLFNGSPSRRRSFLDETIQQLVPDYTYNLNKYKKILQNRNKLLLGDRACPRSAQEELLSVFDEQLAEHGSFVWGKRQSFFDQITPLFNREITALWPDKEKPYIIYRRQGSAAIDSDKIRQQFKSRLAQAREKDRRLGRTTFGPHLDDLEACFQERNIHNTASRGELRALVIALKLGELVLVEQATKEPPVLLLDDIMSELDPEHRILIEKRLQGHQTFITSTEETFFSSDLLVGSTSFIVTGGTIKKREK